MLPTIPQISLHKNHCFVWKILVLPEIFFIYFRNSTILSHNAAKESVLLIKRLLELWDITHIVRPTLYFVSDPKDITFYFVSDPKDITNFFVSDPRTPRGASVPDQIESEIMFDGPYMMVLTVA